MVTVVHSGRCRSADRTDLTDELGPNGGLARARSTEPGYLGCLLLVAADDVATGTTDFVLIEMWDERLVQPSVTSPDASRPRIVWTLKARVMQAIR